MEAGIEKDQDRSTSYKIKTAPAAPAKQMITSFSIDEILGLKPKTSTSSSTAKGGLPAGSQARGGMQVLMN